MGCITTEIQSTPEVKYNIVDHNMVLDLLIWLNKICQMIKCYVKTITAIVFKW